MQSTLSSCTTRASNQPETVLERHCSLNRSFVSILYSSWELLHPSGRPSGRTSRPFPLGTVAGNYCIQPEDSLINWSTGSSLFKVGCYCIQSHDLPVDRFIPEPKKNAPFVFGKNTKQPLELLQSQRWLLNGK